MRHTVRRLAVPTLTALAVAACGSGGGSGDATATGSGSSAAPSSGSSAALSSGSSAVAASSSASASVDTSDPKAFAARLAEGSKSMTTYHVATSGGAGTHTLKGSGDVDLSSGPPRMSVTMTIGEQTTQMRVVDGAAYLALAGDTPAGKFEKVTFEQMRRAGLGMIVDSLDVGASQKQAMDAIVSVKDGGIEEVDGEKLHKYTTVSDGAKVREAARAMLRQSTVEQTDIDTSLAQIPNQVPTTVWVDDQFRTHRQVASLVQLKLTTTFSKINEPVRIEAPAASQVITPR